jgi:predicted AAA+ superfamily ATPase
MAFVVGPRQVGKTTTCRRLGEIYLLWDNPADRRSILEGPDSVARRAGLKRLTDTRPVVVLDELHKFGRWKGFLKGFFDTYGDRVRAVVTGSSRMDVYRRGGDSLMGRYFLFRMHPFSVGEILRPAPPDEPLRPPRRISEAEFHALWEHGGFPEPFVKRDRRFTTRWRGLRRAQLLREDLRDLTRIQELAQVEMLADLLEGRVAAPVVLDGLAREVGVSIPTVKRWIETLVRLQHGFLVRPWFRNVARSLRKEPKWYPRDWSEADDEGARAEAMVAAHLLKAVETWTDLGMGRFELRYLRDKQKREVDFAVIRDGKPWFLVEAKRSDDRLTPSLAHFQRQTGAAHAFQVVLDLDYVDVNAFTRGAPTVVPARTLLSQLP